VAEQPAPTPEAPVAANVLEKLDEVATEAGGVAKPATAPTTQCPAGHALVCVVGDAGSCDACGGMVRQGQMVFECKACNYFVCQTCRPIEQCKKGHTLQTAAAIAGKCDGCSRVLKAGEVVMDCRECNYYLCRVCRPVTQCPTGHKLQKWASQAPGNCDSCSKGVPKGSMVMDCRRCNWFLCEACHPTTKTSGTSSAHVRVPEVALALPRCSAGHIMQPLGAKAGSCNGCGKLVKTKGLVMSCEACNWYLCGACSPVKHCPEGHDLEADMALAGSCDCCARKVQDNEMVMQCRQCNWYLCSTCHITPH